MKYLNIKGVLLFQEVIDLVRAENLPKTNISYPVIRTRLAKYSLANNFVCQNL